MAALAALILAALLAALALAQTTTPEASVYTTSGATFLASTRGATSSATSTAMASLSTTSASSSTSVLSLTSTTAASATSLSTSGTDAALSLSATSRASSLAASATTAAQTTSTASFISSTSSIASLSASTLSSTTAATTTTASSTTSPIIATTPLVLLEVLFRAPCINGRSFIDASKVPLLYQFSYDGCVAGSNATISMLLLAVDVEGLDAQTAVLKQSQLYFGNQSAVYFTKLVSLTNTGPLDTVYPDRPTGPPVSHPGPPVWAIVLALVFGGLFVVLVGVGVMACVTKRTIDKGYAALNLKSALQT